MKKKDGHEARSGRCDDSSHQGTTGDNRMDLELDRGEVNDLDSYGGIHKVHIGKTAPGIHKFQVKC